MFADYDKSKQGKISIVELRNLMWTHFHIPELQTEALAKPLDVEGKGIVNYGEFLRQLYTATTKKETFDADT